MARGLGTRGRFAVAYLLLGAAVGTAIGVFVVLLQRPEPLPPADWSTWGPAAASVNGQALEIADHVGRSYRLPTGDPLVAVKVGGPEQTGGVRAIGVPKTPQPQSADDIDHYEEDETVTYTLCGLNEGCAIPAEPTKQLGTLLRREALELALYTLEYVRPIEHVLVFLPPTSSQAKISVGLFFHRSDLSSHLDKPLRRTLPKPRLPLSGKVAASEQKTVDDLTGSKLYQYVRIVSEPGYGDVIWLQPLS
jgi:hypothetical protein